MDILKYAAKCGRKESGFENLKTRFQDCNLSGEQENKPDGMIEKNSLSIGKENGLQRKQSVFAERWKEKKQTRTQESKIIRQKYFRLSCWHE